MGPADLADGFENGSAGEICDDNSLDLHGAGRPESGAARHGRLAACNDHGSSTGAHGALWNSSSRCIYNCIYTYIHSYIHTCLLIL